MLCRIYYIVACFFLCIEYREKLIFDANIKNVNYFVAFFPFKFFPISFLFSLQLTEILQLYTFIVQIAKFIFRTAYFV